jgi:hypothetical protein
MTKRLTMAAVDTILTLHKAGHSNRSIAALLGVNLEMVGRQLARAQASIQPQAPTGSSQMHDRKNPYHPPLPTPNPPTRTGKNPFNPWLDNSAHPWLDSNFPVTQLFSK